MRGEYAALPARTPPLTPPAHAGGGQCRFAASSARPDDRWPCSSSCWASAPGRSAGCTGRKASWRRSPAPRQPRRSPSPATPEPLHQGRRHRPSARRPVRLLRAVEVRDTRDGPHDGHLPDPAAGTPRPTPAVGGTRLGAAEAQHADRTTPRRHHHRRLHSRNRKTQACSPPPMTRPRASSIRWIPRRSAPRSACRMSHRSS